MTHRPLSTVSSPIAIGPGVSRALAVSYSASSLARRGTCGGRAWCRRGWSLGMNSEGTRIFRLGKFVPRSGMARVESPDEKAILVGNSMRAGEGTSPTRNEKACSLEQGALRGAAKPSSLCPWRWVVGRGLRSVPECGWSGGWSLAYGSLRSEGGASFEACRLSGMLAVGPWRWVGRGGGAGRQPRSLGFLFVFKLAKAAVLAPA